MTIQNVHLVSPMERVRHLKGLSFLQELPFAEVTLFAQHSSERSFRKGETILGRGEPVGSFHVIVEGLVEARGGEYGEVSTLGAQKTIGLLSLLARSEEGVDALALADTTTLEIESDILVDLFEDRFALLLNLIRRVAVRILEYRMKIPDGTILENSGMFPELKDDPIDLVARVVTLRRAEVFRRASMDAIIRLASTMEEIRIPAGTGIWQRGEPSGFMLLPIDGRIRCQVTEDRAFSAGPGYPAGNLESQAAKPRWYTATAETDLLAIRTVTNVLHDIMEDNTEMAMDLIANMARGLIALGREAASGLTE